MLKRKSRKHSKQDTPLQRSITKRPFQKRLQWTEQEMTDAMKAVKDGKLNITAAARNHGVPRTTLHDRIKGNVLHGAKPGPKPYLTMNEKTKLAEFIIKTAVGCGKTRSEVMAITENVACEKGVLKKENYRWMV